MLDHRKSRISREMAHVGGVAGDQIVDRQNFPAAIEEIVAQMRPEKSRASRDYRAQGVSNSLRQISGWLRFFMILKFLMRSRRTDSLNFIVAAASNDTKPGSADPVPIYNCPLSASRRRRDDRRTAIDLDWPPGYDSMPALYDHAARSILFAAMLSILQ
jgi:hypothetical protein